MNVSGASPWHRLHWLFTDGVSAACRNIHGVFQTRLIPWTCKYQQLQSQRGTLDFNTLLWASGHAAVLGSTKIVMSLTKAFINVLETPCCCFHGIWCLFGKEQDTGTEQVNTSENHLAFHSSSLSFVCGVTPSIERAREHTISLITDWICSALAFWPLSHRTHT